MSWTIVRHWAELALVLAVYNLFRDCHGVMDIIKVVEDADDLTRLGMVTATAIASNGLASIVKVVAHELGLSWVVEMIRRRLK